MSDISPIHRPAAAVLNGTTKQRPHEQAAESPTRKNDRVELSDHAKYLGQLQSLPPVREGLVEQVKSQIEDGTYETPDRFETAISNFIADLRDEDLA